MGAIRTFDISLRFVKSPTYRHGKMLHTKTALHCFPLAIGGKIINVCGMGRLLKHELVGLGKRR